MKYPRLIDEVLDVIANSKNSKGVPVKSLVDNVKMYLAARKIYCQNVTEKVKKTVEYCIKTGLIKQKLGYYKWGLEKKEYAIYKLFRSLKEESQEKGEKQEEKSNYTSETSGSATPDSKSSRSQTSVTESVSGSYLV